MTDPIPYGRQWIDEEDCAAVLAVLRSDYLTQGPAVDAFEQAAAARLSARHAVAAINGTAALHLAMLAGGVGPGDEVVVPANTFLATANAAVYVGATPVFADVDPVSGLASPEAIAAKLTNRTAAVIPVHFAGQPCDMKGIAEIVRERCPQALIVEDACHALGADYPDGKPVGSLAHADLVVLSFHPVKHITTAEGGMILADRDDLAEALRRFRSHGTTKDPARLTRIGEGPWYYEMSEVGFNYRLPDLNCALGLSQFRRLDAFVARRRELAERYHAALAGRPGIVLPPPRDVSRSSWHLYVLHVDFAGLDRDRRAVVEALRERGVLTQVHYFPVPLQPYYQRAGGHREEDFPGAVAHYRTALSIPLFPALTDEEQDRVIAALRAVLG